MISPKSIAICVPARNEAALLPHLLDALGAQHGAHEFSLCVLLDACTDASRTIIRRRAGMLPFQVLVGEADSPVPNAGLARRRAMELGLSCVAGDGAIIISTDADTIPDPTWLAANMRALQVADVATGFVQRDGGRPSAMQDRVEAYYDALYALRRMIDPVPWEAAVRTHHYASAASMAFRAEAYRAVGGFMPVGHGEDGQIIDAAHRIGLRVRRDAMIRVTTSDRRDGRATGGLAEHLRRQDASACEPLVAHPADVAWRYRRHAAARRAWDDLGRSRCALAGLLACDVAHVDRVAARVGNAEAFATCVVPDIASGERQIGLAEAETALAALSIDKEALAA